MYVFPPSPGLSVSISLPWEVLETGQDWPCLIRSLLTSIIGYSYTLYMLCPVVFRTVLFSPNNLQPGTVNNTGLSDILKKGLRVLSRIPLHPFPNHPARLYSLRANRCSAISLALTPSRVSPIAWAILASVHPS